MTLMLAIVAPLASAAPRVSHLQQGWSPATRQRFYTTTQGSRMMRYDWFRALEIPSVPDATTDRRFLRDDLGRFGYLPNERSASNPDGLPVGFVVDRARDGTWIGLTCAACHTSQIEHGGTTLQIDGGPANADLSAFLTAANEAVQKTSTDDATFARFAHDVLGRAQTPAATTALRAELADFAAYWGRYVADSTPAHAFGPARTDAFGLIFNRVTSIDLGIPSNSQPPDAPVSYPCLWDTTWHDRVQWDGAADNRTAGKRLARNVGEALGVFATVTLPEPGGLPPLFYRSSVRRRQLLELENWVSELRAPAWPEHVLGPIDPAKKTAGREIYEKRCAACHQLVDPWAADRHLQTKMIAVDKLGTDPTLARNNRDRRADSGRLEGVRMPPRIGTPLAANDTSFNIVKNVVIGALLELPIPIVFGANRRLTGHDIRAIEDQLHDLFHPGGEEATLAYRARPLDGIWATAPYLHNGSVPSLYELLLPASERSTKFAVGARTFDPINVGFSTAAAPGTFEFDTSLPGNRNTGHEYATQLDDGERRALVEYLKSL